jgi:hypothetical protein
MKNALLGAVAGIALMAAIMPARADLPVIDFAALGQWITSLANQEKAYATQLQQWATQQLSWTKQVQQYLLQVQQYENEAVMLENFVHNPSLGAVMGLLSTAGLGNSLPGNPYAVMSLVSSLRYGNGGFAELNGIVSSLNSFAGSAYSTNHVYTPTTANWASTQMVSNANSIAGEQGAMQAAYSDLRTHAAALQALRDHLNTASSPKDVQDTQATIELETLWTQNEAAQMSAIKATFDAQHASSAQQDDEKIAHDFAEFESQNPYAIK